MRKFAQVVLPLALPGTFTYWVPDEFCSTLQVGQRVEVQFGRTKHYAGLVESISQDAKQESIPHLKPILQILDEHPIVTDQQLYFWKWMASYYACYWGEIMSMALPAGLKMSSDTSLVLNEDFVQEAKGDWPEEVMESIQFLRAKGEVKTDELRKYLGKKSLGTLLNYLIDHKIVFVKENLVQHYKAKKEVFVKLAFDPAHTQDLSKAFAIAKKSNRQTSVLLYLIQMSKQKDWIGRSVLYKKLKVDLPVLNALEKKNLIQQQVFEVSRLKEFKSLNENYPPLTKEQENALAAIQGEALQKPILLSGVAGSGKTGIYMECIEHVLREGGQVLYLAPEIGLGTQLLQRLKKKFGSSIHPYHSRLHSAQRVEVWQAVLQGYPIVLGSRSALFLPYQNLRLIIVDEEQDESYKQFFSNPKYHARDMALVLGRISGARVILGSATPSMESIYNAETGKYKLIDLQPKASGGAAPIVECVHTRTSERIMRHRFQLTEVSLKQLEQCLEKGEQALLFLNRRGYAPLYECTTCAWSPKCSHCDVSLTYHRYTQQLHCHYCGHKERLPDFCSSCGHQQFDVIGAGTQRVEDELKLFLPHARVSRLDLDQARSQSNLEDILQSMEDLEIDVLVGTKMVVKGLDFQKLSLGIVVNGDRLFSFPNFRAQEFALQLLHQLKGSLSRHKAGGKLLIQTSNPDFPLFQYLKESSYMDFYRKELTIRESNEYPPFSRLIKVTLQHKEIKMLETSAQLCKNQVEKLDYHVVVLGPTEPMVGRIKLYYQKELLLKVKERGKPLSQFKHRLLSICRQLEVHSERKGLKFSIDVDPL
jgi:primosomal protein N' (replication factor Y) (superfamily II helicase)